VCACEFVYEIFSFKNGKVKRSISSGMSNNFVTRCVIFHGQRLVSTSSDYGVLTEKKATTIQQKIKTNNQPNLL
jgi:hypothetical protein